MGIMTRMRDNMPVILIGLLVAFVITIVFEWGMDYLGMRGGGADVIGTVNGKKISYREFTELVRSMTEMQKAQTGAEPDENQLKQVREQVWQSLVTEYLLEEEIQRFDIEATDQELIDWVRGDNPPEDLRRNFVDSTGQFRRDLYDQFLSNPNQFIRDPQGVDPNYGTNWLVEYEQGLRARRQQEKLQSLMMASIRVTEGEIRQRFVEQYQTMTASYCLFDANTLVKDDEVELTEEDFRNYYEGNLDRYRYEATRTLNYVVLPENPSTSDSAARWNDMEEVAEKARSGLDFIDLASTYSDTPDSGAFFRHGEMNAALENAAFAAHRGDIVGPVEDADGIHLLKVLDERTSQDEFVRARHILFTLTGAEDTNTVTARADSVTQAVREGADFAQVAVMFSEDPGSARVGGDLGWFGKGKMTPAFENAAFSARVGEIVGPLRSPFGLHIIEVTDRDVRELKIAHIGMKIEVSPQTRNDVFDRSRDFSYNAQQTDFATEAGQMGFDIRETTIQEDGGVIPGIGLNESITKWAFNNSVGSVSEPYTMTNGYAILTIADARDAGVRPLDEVKESIRPLAFREAKIDRTIEMAAEVRNQLGPEDGLTAAQALNTDLKVQDTGEFTLSAAVPGVGRDMSFLGTVAGLDVGAVSPAIRGTRGAYLIQLLSRSDLDSVAYASQKEDLKTQLLQEKRNRVLADWLDQLKNLADIEDHRDLYFR
ncbi:MAG: peptidylprolyl isomerase [Bacteroidota bacterium]